MRVHLTTAAPPEGSGEGTGIDHCAYDKLAECARVDRFGEHELTDDPDEAELIVFAELGFTAGVGLLDARLRGHPLVHRHRAKCFVFNSADEPVAFLPGIYPSIERRWYDERRVRSGHYISTHFASPPLVVRPPAERDLLFSFLGTAANHPVRRAVMELRDPEGLCRDVSAESKQVWNDGPDAVGRFLGDYADVMSRSHFALCPRGLGPSSIRLFESMRFGVAPVVISDQWVAPTGPRWEEFSVRVAERDVRRIPELLRERRDRSEEMGRAARRAWEDWFSDEVTFHRVVGWCREIVDSRGPGGDPAVRRARAYAQAATAPHLRGVARHLARRLRGNSPRGNEP